MIKDKPIPQGWYKLAEGENPKKGDYYLGDNGSWFELGTYFVVPWPYDEYPSVIRRCPRIVNQVTIE